MESCIVDKNTNQRALSLFHRAMGSENGASAVSVTHTKLFINGSFVDALSGKTFQTIDPRTGEAIAEVAEADKEDVDIAVAAARKAFEEGPWPRLSGAERGRILFKWADLIEKHAKELAALETLDNGKPLQMSINIDLPVSLKFIRHFAGWADKIQGSTFKLDGAFHGYTLYEPIGVVGAIIPWNFPIAMFFLKAAPALVCGNTLLLKSAEQTPLTALYLASLSKEAGVPPGVLNVLSGYGPTAGAAIASHMNVDKIAFTGSTNVGRLIMEMSAKSNLKPVTLELGGKSPLIICNDADLDQAVEIAHWGLFFNQGQACLAGSRIFVQDEIYEEYIRKAAERAKQIVVGDPFKAETQQGPQVDQDQFNIIMGYIEAGKGEGAKLLTGGSRFGTKGYYIEPTVFADVQDNMKIAREEIFGPVMSILKFKCLEEAIERANNTTYGLAAGIVTKNWDVANRLSRAIKAGTVWINCYGIGDAVMPFGGYKMSGIGRECGIMGLLNYLQIKSVITPLKDAPWL